MRRRSALLTAAALGLGLVLTADAAAFAATGSSLVLGRLNSAGATTTITMTGTGSALRLLTASAASAPLTTNATGRVVNLNADRVDGYDAGALVTLARTGVDATRLGGRTLTEVLALAPASRLTFVRSAAAQQPNPGAFPGVLSGAGADPGTYRITGSVTVPCEPGNTSGYTLSVLAVHSATQRTTLVDGAEVPAARCGAGTAVPVSTTATMTSTTRLLVQVHDIDAGGPADGELVIALRGEPTLRVL
jgi:hypothetical protein